MRFNDAVLGLVILAFAAYVGFTAWSFPISVGVPYGPGYFPLALAMILAGCGALLIWRGLRDLPTTGLFQFSPAARRPANWVGVAIILASVSLYSYLDDVLGFHITATLVVSSLVLFLWGRAKIGAALIIGFVVSLVIYFVFARLLLVPLPLGVVGRILS